MNRKWMFIFLIALFNSTSNAFPYNNLVWQSVWGLGGGFSSSSQLGRSQSFTDNNFYSYTPKHVTQAPGLFEFFLGAETLLPSCLIVQPGLTFAQQTGTFTVRGNLLQGTSASTAQQYTYKYEILPRQMLVQTKLMRSFHTRFYPYFLAGFGISFNSSKNFTTSVPMATREYEDNLSTTFAYRLGLGIDTQITTHLRLGVGYRFANLGGASFGPVLVNSTNVPGTISQSTLNANEGLIQLTYVTTN